MLNILRVPIYIISRVYTYFRGYMEPRKFRQPQILKWKIRPSFTINCKKGLCKPTINKFEQGYLEQKLLQNDFCSKITKVTH